MYATTNDIRARFPTAELIQLTDEDCEGVVNEAKVAAALADAVSQINTFLVGTYQLPLDPAPSILKTYACDIAWYRLWKGNAPENVRQLFEDALDWLKLVAKGVVKLEVSGVETAGAPETILIQDNLIADRRSRLRGF